jgi:hypothetical protein
MTTPAFELKDYRQPVVTSLGVILGFLLGFLGQWVTEDGFALKNMADHLVFFGCLTSSALLLLALYRMLRPLVDASAALADYRVTLGLYMAAIGIALGCLVVSAFI